MKQNPIVVDYIDWEIVLKCKSNKYTSEEECLKSIWTEEYSNPIEQYNTGDMIAIMSKIIEAVMPVEQRANLLKTILCTPHFRTDKGLLHELYIRLMCLDVRRKADWGKHYDLYIINREGKYYTIDQYDEIKEI
jgi:hypothetical protein